MLATCQATEQCHRKHCVAIAVKVQMAVKSNKTFSPNVASLIVFGKQSSNQKESADGFSA